MVVLFIQQNMPIFVSLIKQYAMELNIYRLNSMEEPSDEILHQLMERVAIEARKSSRNAKLELKRRMQETAKKIAHLKALQEYKSAQ